MASSVKKKKPDRTCFVPGCSSGYRSQRANANKITLFCTPKQEKLFTQWANIIPRADKHLDEYSVVCELHFDERFLERSYKYTIDDKEVILPRTKPRLTADAYPTIFPNLPHYLTKKLPAKRKPTVRLDPPPKKKKTECTMSNVDMTINDNKDEVIKIIEDVSLPSNEWSKIVCSKKILFCFHKNLEQDDDIKSILNTVSDPSKVIYFKVDGQKIECAIHANGKLVKNIELTACDNIKNEIDNVLKETDNLKLCSGCGLISEFGMVKLQKNFEVKNELIQSKNCSGYIASGSKDSMCMHCKASRRRLMHSKLRAKTAKLKKIQNMKYLSKRNRELTNKMKLLKNEVKSVNKNASEIFNSEFEKKIKMLPSKQQLAINECFKASLRKSTNGMLYEKEWLLECIIMKMKSPRLYEHLRLNKILTLPSKSCLNSYLRNFSQGYGFNTSLLSILKEKVSALDNFEKHGTLIFDELKLSENLQLMSDGTISGYVDYGLQTPEYLKNELCDHGLLLIFQPFTGDWVQIIGVFATHKNMKADILTKTLIEAVVHCENAGLNVECITGDGASWNRAMWAVCGIGEASNGEIVYKVAHPCDLNRFLHFMSDFPHLIKCVRNALLKTGFLCPMGEIRVKLLKAAWKRDSQVPVALKVMPKITSVHFHPNSFEKMRVGYAFQLFSLDVIKSLHFYQKDIERYGDSKPTIDFVEKVNSLIIAMTSRHPKDGLRQNSRQEENIKSFLEFMSMWKKKCGKGGKGFLSRSTALGLQKYL